MKGVLIAGAFGLALINIQVCAADVGISVNIGEPGFYGRLDLGDFPQPPVIYSQPIAVEPVPIERPPVYLRVPPGYERHWERHCREYRACGERVYFVRDNWYRNEYAPRYRERDRGDDRWREGGRGEGWRGEGGHGRGRGDDDH